MDVVRQERRQRREKHRVDEDDRADQEQEPTHASAAPTRRSTLEEGAQTFLSFGACPETCGELCGLDALRSPADQLLGLSHRLWPG